MKKTLLLGAAVLAALFAGCDTTTTPEPNPTDAYVPLAQGNEWDYAWDLPEDGDPMNWYVTGSEDGAWRVELNWGETVEDWLWRHTADGEFQAKPADEENWRTYLKTPIELDNTWTFTDDDGVVWRARIGDTNAVFNTPAGYFDQCVRVAIWRENAEHDWEWTENYWFKEGIGIIRVAIDDDDSGEGSGYDANWKWVLNYYKLK